MWWKIDFEGSSFECVKSLKECRIWLFELVQNPIISFVGQPWWPIFLEILNPLQKKNLATLLKNGNKLTKKSNWNSQKQFFIASLWTVRLKKGSEKWNTVFNTFESLKHFSKKRFFSNVSSNLWVSLTNLTDAIIIFYWHSQRCLDHYRIILIRPDGFWALRILTGKKHRQIKLQRLRKVRIWAFGSLLHQINSL